MDDVQYNTKKEQILAKFTTKFVEENYPHDAMFHQIVEVLAKEGNIFPIIETLLKQRQILMNANEDLIERKTIQIVVPAI